jgi:two-component system, OmpR family, KDP operon response regulator KdpE
MARVLVVDDDPSLLRVLRVGLRARGHEVSVASNGEQGISQAALLSPDVIVLDLGLPDVDGLTVCRRIRSWSDVPIVVLSANDAEDRKVAALNEGADDYVTKPFGMAELEARIRTAIRHQRVEPDTPATTVITVGDVSIDLVHHEAHLKGAPVRLTSKEFGVLSFLMRNEGKVCTHEMILTAVWGPSYARESQYLHVYVNRLRQKLGESSGLFLRAVPGIGYVLTTKDE